MGKARKQSKQGKRALIKRYIKLLAVNPDPVQNLALVKNAPDDVIKTICNAAYNVTHGSIPLKPKQKTFFRKYKAPISKLVEQGPSITQKRKTLVQKGGAFFLPMLLSAVLSTLGSALFQK